MLVIKQCKCGSRDFEMDDEGCLRCAECWSRAVKEWIEDEEESES